MAECLRVVATQGVALKHLAALPRPRQGISCKVVADLAELTAALHADPNSIALLEIEAGDIGGYLVCRGIKDDRTLADTRVALVLPPGKLDRTTIERLASSGCDDVIMPPLTTDGFYGHLAQLTDLPLRRGSRIAVDLPIELRTDIATHSGQVTNVGVGGIGFRAPLPLSPGDRVIARLRFGDQTSPDTHGAVAWCRIVLASKNEDPHEYDCGLAWDGDLPLGTRLLLEQGALFDVAPDPDEGDGAAIVRLYGDFTEMTRFDALAPQLAGTRQVTFDLAGVRYLSSAGVRSWCELLASLDSRVDKRFRQCSVAFASQAAMVPLVLADGEVLSLEAPYYCEQCERDQVRLLEIGAIAKDADGIVAPSMRCGNCGGNLELDDLPDRYFAFLNE